MAPVTFTMSHSLGADVAKNRVEKGVNTLTQRFASHLSVCETRWEDHTLHFLVGVMKQQVSGTCELTDTTAVVSFELPWLLAPFRQKIQQVLGQELPKALAPPKQT
ncbi:polyhydroxyalkanoic acid system family protein [Chelatococcus reniformis]|uniref:Polyhydroxyalkanoic acid synthase n=1 Tax=Chelatococcus reniformis TaxID=1494448 RepID=A0A916XE02_9HYPH|nr:polyhydroxyalkanoic acid system family protein [Chelatococcus reniformis]GGC64770.1 hypothetical protein GCM10010994_24170 [Chelatococcus reniformis]